MSNIPRRSILRRAVQLGQLADNARAAGDHGEAAKLYRDALLLLEWHFPEEDDGGAAESNSLRLDGASTARAAASIFATTTQSGHSAAARTDGGGESPKD